tara:strand:+ start:247 stop:1320 length:1074 start_codon:yes stop_codon:yes gene_type:complete
MAHALVAEAVVAKRSTASTLAPEVDVEDVQLNSSIAVDYVPTTANVSSHDIETAALHPAGTKADDEDASTLLQSVTPLSGPNRGGTSLTISLGHNHAVGAQRWTLDLGTSAQLNCTPGGEAAIRCCCTPPANGTLGAALLLRRCDGLEGSCSQSEQASFGTPFRYYADPQLARVSPDRGGVSGGELVTISARGWPDASTVGAVTPRCRFGALRSVACSSSSSSSARAAGFPAAHGALAAHATLTKLVCTSPDFHRTQRAAAGSVLLQCAPNGVDFPSAEVLGGAVEGEGLLYRFTPQPYLEVLVSLVVLLGALLLLRAAAWFHTLFQRKRRPARGIYSRLPQHQMADSQPRPPSERR